jgi:signal transduction histidine kinase
MLFLISVKVGSSQLKTALRLLPILFVVLLPMAPLDNMVLEAHYELRGQEELPLNTQIKYVKPNETEEALENLLQSLQPGHCVSFNLKVQTSYCLNIDLNSRYTLNSLLDLRPLLETNLGNEDDYTRAQDSSWEPLYYQRFLPTSETQTKGVIRNENNSLLILLPQDPLPPFKFSTPLGELYSHEVAITLGINSFKKTYLEVGSYSLQVIIGIVLAALYLLFPYQFPIWIGGFAFIATSLIYYALSLILFDQWNFLLPTAGPLCGLGASYILSATDQLSRKEETQRTLEYDSIKLRELDKLKNHFLSLVSHDLKTPIARMQALLEQLVHSLSKGKKEENSEELLSHALAANEQLQRSINTLLLMNRIESRDFSLQKSPTDLPKLIQNSLKGPSELARNSRVELTTELEPMFLVDLDSGIIQEVILNLLDNAIKFTPQNRKITIRCGEDSKGVWIEVQDEGTGIPPGEREKVWELFFQGSNDGKIAGKASHGSGLGLYLCAFFVNEHEGSLELYSRCQDEELSSTNPAFKYFQNSSTGTLVRVALPIESIYDRPQHEN